MAHKSHTITSWKAAPDKRVAVTISDLDQVLLIPINVVKKLGLNAQDKIILQTNNMLRITFHVTCRWKGDLEFSPDGWLKTYTGTEKVPEISACPFGQNEKSVLL